MMAGFQRQIIMATVKFGCYDSVKHRYCKLFDVSEDPRYTPKSVKFLSAATTGAFAVLIGQPTDVVKTRTLAKLDSYKTTGQAYREIYRTEGVWKGLWRGTVPGALRNMAVNSAEIGLYDTIKGTILRNEWIEEDWRCYVMCSTCTGVAAALVSSPADVIKTVYSNSTAGQYGNLVECCRKMWREEGLRAYYRGLTFNGSRMVVWNVCMFFSLEQIRIQINKTRNSSLN